MRLFGVIQDTLPEIVRTYNGKVHNFSAGCLFCYFRLELPKQILKAPEGIVSFQYRGKIKTFVFANKLTNLQEKYLQTMQEKGPVYSEIRIPLKKEQKCKEIAYSVSDVFNPDSYPNAKKRHQRIVYPINWIEKQGYTIEEIKESNISEIQALHAAWVDFKMNQPGTFKIMFPTGRYIHCCENILTGLLPGLKGFVVRNNKQQIEVVRVIYQNQDKAFDLAFFGNIWNAPSQLMNYADICVLRLLHLQGITFFNCGLGLNKSLSSFKQHLPSMEIISYCYPKI